MHVELTCKRSGGPSNTRVPRAYLRLDSRATLPIPWILFHSDPTNFIFGENVISIFIYFLKINKLYSHHLFDQPPFPRLEQPRSKVALIFGPFHTMAVAGWPTCKSGPTTMATI
jgi:hypothetical protein